MNCPPLMNLVQVFCGNPNNPNECVLASQVCDGATVHCTTGLDETAATCSAVCRFYFNNNLGGVMCICTVKERTKLFLTINIIKLYLGLARKILGKETLQM